MQILDDVSPRASRSIEVPATEATCDADFGATRNVCASKENPSVNWHGMAGGSERHYFGDSYKDKKGECAQKCKDLGQPGCCEYRGSGVCVFKVDGFKKYSSGHSDAQTLMCRTGTASLLESSAGTADNSTLEVLGYNLPAVKKVEISATWDEARLQDFKFKQDCGEHAVNSFGYLDEDNDQKLEIFAKCTTAAQVGNREWITRNLGGEMDIGWSTCTGEWAETADWIKYSINDGWQWKTLGNKGRDKGSRDKMVLKYDEPFNSMTIKSDGDDGWQICKLTAGGEELPTAAMQMNFYDMPCFIDSDLGVGGDNGCVVRQLNVVGNRMSEELADARIECGPGKVVTSYEMTGTQIKYSCGMVTTIGACREWQSEQSDTSSGKFDALRYVQVTCPEYSLLQKAVGEYSKQGQWFRYRYQCCQSGGVPISIAPTGNYKTDKLNDHEGIYCPVRRDTHGRLEFSRTFAFKTASTAPYELKFNSDAMQWCIGETCQDSMAAHPLEDGFYGKDFEVIPLSDFVGDFGPPPEPPKPKPKPGPRKKPTLIEFKAAQPEVAEECMNEMMPDMPEFDLDKYNKKGMELPDGNPCKLMAGGWEEDAGFGSSYWSTHGYTDDSEIEHHAGTTYDTVRGCGDREISRDLKAAEWDWHHDTLDSSVEFALDKISPVCSVLPDISVAPLGVGTSIGLGDICDIVLELVGAKQSFASAYELMEKSFGMDKDDNADCNSMQHGISRIYCDLHCIRDAVKAGDSAILSSLEGAVTVIGKNTDLLMEYYVGTLQDQLDTIKTSMEEAQGSSLQRVKEVKSGFRTMFSKLRRTLGSAQDASAKATAVRALNSFAAEFAAVQDPATMNASAHLDNLVQKAEALTATLHTAAEGAAVSSAAAQAKQSAVALAHLERVLEARTRVLGVYTGTSQKAKEKMRLLAKSREATAAEAVDEVRAASAMRLLQELDNTWWNLRTSIDSYLELATEQAHAYGSAFAMLDAYTTTCTAGFAQLQAVYDRSQRTEAQAHVQLKATWGAVSKGIGLLAAQLQDGQAFMQLARLDANAVGANFTGAKLCGGSAKAVAAAFAAEAAAYQNSKESFVQQTLAQLRDSLMQVPMLRDRFLAGGMRRPDTKWAAEAFVQISQALKEAQGRAEEVATEWVERSRRAEC
eukprot:TRINITY_DN288_c0_g1_i11.p1 TRINITY_DN288_c0_g1~~TRINITY_DN288_c0_g1_i11.p1  ORF type:complete len:1150 (-),score=283.33 TRINITY_DN288_c0_g1_i11:79-3528(-)